MRRICFSPGTGYRVYWPDTCEDGEHLPAERTITEMTPSTVRHNEAENRFEAEVNGQLAVAEYERTGDTIRFFHTQVPQQFQGKGIGESMAKAALDYSRDNELHVVPLCQFIDAYMRKHPEYAALRQKKKTQE